MYLDELFGLQGKVALVTGGSQGIGQVIAEGFAKAGADVVLMNRGNSDATLAAIKAAGRRGLWLPVDVTDEPAVEAALKQAISSFGQIDVLFNNAGICLHKGSLDVTAAEFRNIVDVNLTGEFIVARAVGRHMIEKGVKGSIVNMASISGSITNTPQVQASYNASKAAVISLSKSLAWEWAGHGIRVNSISPGYIATPMADDVPMELKNAWLPLIPQHRMADPRELMTAVLYLASPASTYTTGSDVIVDGGYTVL